MADAGLGTAHYVATSDQTVVWTGLPGNLDPQAAANCLKTVAAGTITLDATSAIVMNSDGTLTLSAGLAASGKVIKGRACRS